MSLNKDENKIQYWESILRKDPNDKDVLHHLARLHEKEAYTFYKSKSEDELKKMTKTQKEEFFNEFRGKLGKATSFYQHAHSKGSIESKEDLRRLQHNYNTLKLPFVSLVKKSGEKKKRRILPYFLLLLLLLLLSYFLLKLNPNPLLQGYFGDKVLNSVKNNNESITKVNAPVINEKDTIEPLTMLRSALYQFVLYNQRFPDDLHELTNSFPDNYLSYIPTDGITGSNKISSQLTGDGGWVYSIPLVKPSTFFANEELNKLIEKSLFPNISNVCKAEDCPFQPFEVVVTKDTHKLTLRSGDTVLRAYDVALGKDNSTPIGSFYINKRVKLPNYQLPTSSRPFGTRGLELSDSSYAIHGTNDSSSIGTDATKGCIRMNNNDIEELFSFVPLFTNVTIQDKSGGNANLNENTIQKNERNGKNSSASSSPYSPSKTDSSDPTKINDNIIPNITETDFNTIYHWAL